MDMNCDNLKCYFGVGVRIASNVTTFLATQLDKNVYLSIFIKAI
jgi:hypothetical protein